ncbi:MAG TPA: VOC family protein [Gaiellaceae bacterium]|nr:VOC family protein [Gaiellaceae bacterium]
MATSGLRILGVYETVLYAPDPLAAAAFYREALGLEPVEDPDELSAAFRLLDGGVLLIFNPQKSSLPGRPVPSHGSAGPGHVAFGLDPGAYEEALAALRDKGIEIEREVDWDRGRSIYFRDPAGNSVELVDGDIWPRPDAES